MAGPDNDYKVKLKKMANKLHLNNNIFWSNMILGNLKWGAITASKGMVLSSHGENFGVSLVESLSCSRPILTTNKVNIYKEILKSKAGYVSKNNISGFYLILKKFYSLSMINIRKLNLNSQKCF